jgi:exopolysaccharide biosynthesis polyprenyl glycosylphosphotransferase
VALITALTDVLLINVAFALAYFVRYELEWPRAVVDEYYVPYQTFLPMAALFTAVLLLTFSVEKVYEVRRGRPWLDEVYAILNGTTNGTILVIAFFFLTGSPFYSRLIFMYAVVAVVVVLGIGRAARNSILNLLRKRGIGVDRVLVVGAGETGRTLMRNIVAQPELGFQIIGYVDDDQKKAAGAVGRFSGLGTVDDLPAILAQGHVDEVIVTLPWMYHRKILRIIAECARSDIRARIVPDMFQMSISHVNLDNLNGLPLLSMQQPAISVSGRAVKRALDVLGAAVVLLLTSPLMALAALGIRLDSPGPILFRQERVGKGESRFAVYKFRTMYRDAEEQLDRLKGRNEATGPLFKIKDDPRITRVGRILRRTSIDELPQLYNVLKGDMSLVGPRPPLPREVTQYQEWHRRRLAVAPGLTGLWQVSGRSDLTFDEMVLLDLYYIENWSLFMDLKVLLRTIPQVLFGRGAY